MGLWLVERGVDYDAHEAPDGEKGPTSPVRHEGGGDVSRDRHEKTCDDCARYERCKQSTHECVEIEHASCRHGGILSNQNGTVTFASMAYHISFVN